jgi:hypothetical protein
VGHVGAWVAGKPRLASWRPWREAVVLGPDGVAVFDALHRRHRAIDALLYAFDLPELDGEDLRLLPLSARKAKLLARKPAGIVFNEHAEEDGAVVFWHACKMGLEGIVSKRLAAPSGRGRPATGSRSRTRTARLCATVPGRAMVVQTAHTAAMAELDF